MARLLPGGALINQRLVRTTVGPRDHPLPAPPAAPRAGAKTNVAMDLVLQVKRLPVVERSGGPAPSPSPPFAALDPRRSIVATRTGGVRRVPYDPECALPARALARRASAGLPMSLSLP
jgi:hypothetical protein